MSNKSLFDMSKLIINTDGGARGNPGPAGIGAVVGGKEYSEYIGKATNNVAEYKAVIMALKKARQLLGKTKAKFTEVEVRLDSQLIERQLNGQYRINEEDLKTLYVDVHNLEFEFKKVNYTHVPREQNKEADRLVNEVLDKEGK